MFLTSLPFKLFLTLGFLQFALASGAQSYDSLKVVGIIGLPTPGLADTGVAVLKDKTGKSIVAKVGRKIPGHDDLTLVSIHEKSVKVRQASGSEFSLLWISGEPSVASASRSAPSYDSYDPEPVSDLEIQEFMEDVPMEPQGKSESFKQLNIKNRNQLPSTGTIEKTEAVQYWERQINQPPPGQEQNSNIPAGVRNSKQRPTRSFMDLNKKSLQQIDKSNR